MKVSECLKAIKLNNSYSMYKLGELYHDSTDYDTARKYYLVAIKLNNKHAYLNLAVMYRDGEGCSVDCDKALDLLNRSHQLGNNRAMTCIGKIYQNQNNITKAKQCYKIAIEKNDDTLANFNMGIIYQHENKHKKAIKHLLKSANQH